MTELYLTEDSREVYFDNDDIKQEHVYEIHIEESRSGSEVAHVYACENAEVTIHFTLRGDGSAVFDAIEGRFHPNDIQIAVNQAIEAVRDLDQINEVDIQSIDFRLNY